MPVIQEAVSVAVDKILLATDFSLESEKAAAYAKALARRFCSVVEIAHVFNPSQVISEEEALLSLPFNQRRQNSEDYLERLQADFFDSGIRAQTVSPEGHDVATILLKIAKDDEIDLIVAGTRSKRGLERLVLGSTAESLLRSARCPVLTVGPKAKPPAGALAFSSIIFATDFSAESVKAAAFALSFAEDSGAHLYFCHVAASHPGRHSEAPDADVMLKEALRRMIPNSSYDWCSPECVVEHGEPSKGILSLAERVHADLIVLGPRKASLIRDHVERGLTPSVLAEATCPVLTVC